MNNFEAVLGYKLVKVNERKDRSGYLTGDYDLYFRKEDNKAIKLSVVSSEELNIALEEIPLS